MLYYFVYVSSATPLLSRSELDDILAVSYGKNERLGVTGALLYKDGNVMQVLEGEEETVLELYATISVDARHKNVTPILKGRQESRQFTGWWMAFRDLDGPNPTSTPGYKDFLDTRLSSTEFTSNPSRCHQLLRSFRASM